VGAKKGKKGPPPSVLLFEACDHPKKNGGPKKGSQNKKFHPNPKTSLAQADGDPNQTFGEGGLFSKKKKNTNTGVVGSQQAPANSPGGPPRDPKGPKKRGKKGQPFGTKETPEGKREKARW